MVESAINLNDRAGHDGGDEGGFMLNRQMQSRGEYVIRSDVDSLQANVVFYPRQPAAVKLRSNVNRAYLLVLILATIASNSVPEKPTAYNSSIASPWGFADR